MGRDIFGQVLLALAGFSAGLAYSAGRLQWLQKWQWGIVIALTVLCIQLVWMWRRNW